MQNRAIGIVPLDNDGYTWLVGQYRYATEEYGWEIPMGEGPLSETPKVLNELEEEVGVVAADWELLLELQLSNCVTSESLGLPGDKSLGHCHPDDTELLTLRRLPLKGLSKWLPAAESPMPFQSPRSQTGLQQERMA